MTWLLAAQRSVFLALDLWPFLFSWLLSVNLRHIFPTRRLTFQTAAAYFIAQSGFIAWLFIVENIYIKIGFGCLLYPANFTPLHPKIKNTIAIILFAFNIKILVVQEVSGLITVCDINNTDSKIIRFIDHPFTSLASWHLLSCWRQYIYIFFAAMLIHCDRVVIV
jgi:hypothetical protein